MNVLYWSAMKLIKKILEELESFHADTGLTIGDFVYHPYKFLYGDLKKLYRADSLTHSLSRAERKGWIKKLINEEKAYVALTTLGREELVKLKEDRGLKLTSGKKRWDGRYRLVIFDIPEKSRIVRDTLRRRLKEFGFVGWQKSVWVTKENVTRALRSFVKENALEDYILVIETTDLGNKKLERVANSSSNRAE
jgi:CRISPR-associated endonuclease Cas2